LAVCRYVENATTHRNAIWQGRRHIDAVGLAVDSAFFLVATILLGLCVYRACRRVVRPTLSLRTLLLAITVVAIVCADLGRQAARCESARQAGVRLEQLGVHVDQGYAGPVWLERLLGEWVYSLPWFIAPRTISLDVGRDFNVADFDEICRQASRLHGLDKLLLNYTSLSGQQVGRLLANCHLSRLRMFAADGVPVTDEAVRTLERARQLQFVMIDASHVTPERLTRLKSLPFVEVEDSR
jgi:hypothetical protein